jgi:hypothetical protein
MFPMPADFIPELSFYASLHWTLPNGQPELHGLSATYLDQAPSALDNGWIYCSSGDSYSGKKRVALGLDEVAGRLVGLHFWFACHRIASSSDVPSYRYNLRVFQEQAHNNPFQFRTLDKSRNGYLALYQLNPFNAPLWEIKGLGALRPEAGAQVDNLTLVSSEGGRVRRLVEDGFPYLSDRAGHDARFTARIASEDFKGPW